MFPTAFATDLAPGIREILDNIDGLITTSALFDPATSRRSFRIAASDYITVSVLVPLAMHLADVAPAITLDIVAPDDDMPRELDEGRLDLLITPEEFVHKGHPTELLFEERHLVVGWSGNPLFERAITAEVIRDAGFVTISFGRRRTPSFADRHLAQLGVERRIEVTAATFTAVPWLLQGTMRLSFMHERLARTIAEFFPIATAAVPFDFPPMREMIQINKACTGDEGLAWLCNQIRRVSQLG
jgi:DNA-binding transcriptional LysR family regulator